MNELQYIPMDPDSSKQEQEASSKATHDEETLQTHLDTLIVSYLDLIDTYTQLQKDISQNFASVMKSANSLLGYL